MPTAELGSGRGTNERREATMTKRFILGVLSLAAVSLWACSSQKAAEDATTAVEERPQFEASETVTAQVHVLAVDKTSRLATVRRDVGDTVTVQVGPEVKNFDQLAAGDVINVVYTEQLMVHVEPPGSMSTSSQTSMSTASPGEKPGGTYGESVETKATITAIDKAKGIATLTGQDGGTFNVTPRIPENLDKVKVGDLVVFTHSQKVAVSVEPGKN
jgi:hypothetical protein